MLSTRAKTHGLISKTFMQIVSCPNPPNMVQLQFLESVRRAQKLEARLSGRGA